MQRRNKELQKLRAPLGNEQKLLNGLKREQGASS